MQENTLRRQAYESAAQTQYQNKRREARKLPPPENLPTLPDLATTREGVKNSEINIENEAIKNKRDFLANLGIENPENLILNNPDILNLSQNEVEEKIIQLLRQLIQLDTPKTMSEVLLKTPSLFHATIDATEATTHD